jgi:Fe2+ transport system protein B
MEVNAIISINTDEINEGTNPDGSPFNTNSIITPSIINKAIIGTDLVLTATVDNQEFKANEMVSYYDKLAERAATSSVLASDTFYDIEYKKFLIASLENDSISNTVKEDLEKESEQVIKKINTKTNQLINKINKLSAEHRDYIMDNAISITSTSQIKKKRKHKNEPSNSPSTSLNARSLHIILQRILEK